MVAKPPEVSTEAFLFSVSDVVPHEFNDDGGGRGSGSGVIPSVSRLDKMTSGVLVVPTNKMGEDVLTQQFKGRDATKTYLALVRGVTASEGRIDAKLHVSKDTHHFRVYVSPKGKAAVTEYRLLRVLKLTNSPAGSSSGTSGGSGLGDSRPDEADTRQSAAEPERSKEVFSLLEVKPLTGRTHQIRAHFASEGFPLVSDTKYKPKVAKRQLKFCPRLFLHAVRLSVRDVDGAVVEAEAPLPSDLQAVLSLMEDAAMPEA